MRRLVVPLLLVLAGLVAVPAVSEARVLVGLGDQNAATYDLRAVRKLHLQTARLALPWNWYRDASAIGATDAWMAAVRRAGLRPLISFTRDLRPRGLRHPPAVPELLQSFALLRYRYPDVREFGVWNEANHKSQPLAHKPRLAARYYNAMRAACPRCTIVAADVLDDPAMPRWIATFKRTAHHPRLWGLHNYRDANRVTGSTRPFLRLVKGHVWLTETGGIRRPLRHFRGSKATKRRESLAEQARAVRRVFTIARSSHRIQRLYFYQWRREPGASWDSAFVNADGSARPALRALRSGLRR